jgi:hypothetical protein
MVLKDMKSAYTVLKIFAESTRVVLYSMDSEFEKSGSFKSNLEEVIGRVTQINHVCVPPFRSKF